MIKRTRADVVFDAFNIFFMLLILVVVLYPLYFTLTASFSNPHSVATGKTFFAPHDFTLELYANVFRDSRIWIGYRNTIMYTVGATALSLVLTIPAAYVMSKKTLPARGVISWYFLFTMYFGGGLIPSYLLMTSLHLVNKPIIMVILMGSFGVYNMIVSRIFFQTTIPEELYEAARIDGASDFRQFFTIAVPLSGPIIAVMSLFISVGCWNNYFTALIYLNDQKYAPLQIIMREILIQNRAMNSMLQQEEKMMDEETRQYFERLKTLAEGMKYSSIWIASAPLLIAYPFVQKYFVKGVMIGSLKG